MTPKSSDHGQQTSEKETPVSFDKDQPSEPAGPPNPSRYDRDELPPSFDEGERKPAPIESTTNDGVRSAPPTSPATSGKVPSDEKLHTEATMPPSKGQLPRRNTM